MDIPKSTRQAIVYGLRHAGRRGNRQMQPEHLLLGILDDNDTPGGYPLADLNVSAPRLRDQIQKRLAPISDPAGQPAERMSDETLTIVNAARAEAEKSGHRYLGNDHLLLAILSNGETAAREALNEAGVTYDTILEAWRGWSRKRRLRRSRLHLKYFDGMARAAKRVAAMPKIGWHVFVGRSLVHPGYVKDPYPIYRWLREHAPVRKDPLAPVWILTRYEDVALLLRDPRFNKDPFTRHRLPVTIRQQLGLDQGVSRPGLGAPSMLFLDPPEHTRVRGMFTRAFSARMIESMRPRIELITQKRLDRAQQRGGLNIINDVAYPLPVVVIAELLGFPPEDYERMKQWSDALAADLSLRPNAQVQIRAAEAGAQLREYFDRLVPELKRKPGENLLSELLAAENLPDALNREEIFSNAVLLLAAGHETTTNLIGNGMLALLRHRDQFKMLRGNLDLMPSAVEELMRFDSPVQWSSRVAGESIAIGGVKLDEGALLLASLGAANRDPEQFPEPDRLDIMRSPNRHVAFGQGAHYCLGATLARMEASIAIRQLIERFPKMRLARQGLDRIGGLTFRGVKSLRVEIK